MKRINAGVNMLDIKIAVAVGFCLVSAKLVPAIQYMAACFAAILCVQEEIKVSWKSGLIRLILTTVGGLTGVIVILLDQVIQNEWIFILMISLAAVLTLWGCKVAGIPYVNARIGVITFILVVMIADGTERINYAVMRLAGTLYGVLAALLVTWFFGLFTRKKQESANEKTL